MFRWHYWVSGFFLLNAMMAFHFIDRLVYGNWLGKGGDKITQTLQLLLILSSLALFGRNYRRKRGIGVGGALALAAIAFLFLTALWSTDPGSTVKEATVYLFVVVGAIGVAGVLNANEFMEVLGLTCFLSAVASIVLLVVSPSNALMPDNPTEIIGIFSHKNNLGQVMATGAFATLHSMQVERGRSYKIFMYLVFAGMALASTSATAFLMILLFSGAHGILALFRRGGAAGLLGTLATVVLLPVLLLVVVAPDSLLELIGKDPTLTGRTEIWDYVISDIWLKPLLGWGYFGFWLPGNPAAIEIANRVKWFVPQAHNGLLEMLLNIGVAGTAIFVYLFARNTTLAFRCLRTSARPLAISTILSCASILMLGVSENVLLAPTQSSTIIFFITGFMCEHAARAARRRRSAQPSYRLVSLSAQGVGHL